MTDFAYWTVFFAAALALNLSPGPDLIYVVSRTVAQGTKVGLASAAGLWTGAFVHVLAVAFGLSTILTTSAKAFAVVKYAGAVYLAYLGVQALRSRGVRFDLPASKEPRVTPAHAYRQGILVDLLNPKVAVFFMAFLPQFVRPGHGNPAMQLIGLGTLVILVAIPVESFCVVAAAHTTVFFRQHPRTAVALDRLLGSILVTLAGRLAFFEQQQ